MIEGKGLGGKKVNRVGVSLSNSYHNKLNRLATACNMKPTSLSGLLIEMCLDNPELIEKLQDEYNTQSLYRVVPFQKYTDGEVEYVIKGN
jgi:hypothetical protein